MLYNELYLCFTMIMVLLVYMLDYGFGRPGDDTFNHHALLFGWTYILAKRRLKILGEWDDLARQQNAQMQHVTSIREEIEVNAEFRRAVVDRARHFYRWEMALGMCPICTTFWWTFFCFLMVNIFYCKVNIITFTLYFLLSHLLIRLIKKI